MLSLKNIPSVENIHAVFIKRVFNSSRLYARLRPAKVREAKDWLDITPFKEECK